MDLKARIGRITAADYAAAGNLSACPDMEHRLSFAALAEEADEQWRSGQTLTLTFDYPFHTVYITLSAKGTYGFDLMQFEPEAASVLPPFPRTAGEMEEKIEQGVWRAERFVLHQESVYVYLLENGMTVHYAGEEHAAPLERIAGNVVETAATRAYLHQLSSSASRELR